MVVTWVSTQDWVGMSSRWRTIVDQREEFAAALRTVVCGVNPDHRIAAAEQQAVEHAGENALRIVGRMVGLQARRQPSLEADRVAEAA